MPERILTTMWIQPLSDYRAAALQAADVLRIGLV